MTDINLLEDERYAAGTISAAYVEAVAVAERGCWPSALLDQYPADPAHIAEYAKLARTEEGFRTWLDRYVYVQPVARAAE